MSRSGKIIGWKDICIFSGAIGSSRPHKHPAHKLIICTGSKFPVNVVGLGVVEIVTSRVYLVPGNVSHQLIYENGVEGLSVYFEACDYEIKSNMEINQAHIGLIDQFCHSVSADTIKLEEVRARVERLASALFSTKKVDPRIRKAIDLLELDADQNIESLAQHSYLSPARFRQLFKTEVSLPFNQYKKWYKVKSFFSFYQKDPNMAGACVYFTDQSHFIKTFWSLFGAKPSSWLSANGSIQFHLDT